MRISDWSSDVCSSDLATEYRVPLRLLRPGEKFRFTLENSRPTWTIRLMSYILEPAQDATLPADPVKISGVAYNDGAGPIESVLISFDRGQSWTPAEITRPDSPYAWRSEEHTSELQSLMRISYAVFCLKKTHHIKPI